LFLTLVVYGGAAFERQT